MNTDNGHGYRLALEYAGWAMGNVQEPVKAPQRNILKQIWLLSAICMMW